MRLERSAERDKREIKIILPLNMARAQAEAIFNRPIPSGAFLRLRVGVSAQKQLENLGSLYIDGEKKAL